MLYLKKYMIIIIYVILFLFSFAHLATLVSPSLQCIDNIRCNGLMTSVFEENSKVTVPYMIK